MSKLWGNTTSRRRTNSAADDLDITPMIDVTFLLLIFFMVTSTMQSTPDIDLPVAHHGTGIQKNQQMIISIVASDGLQPQLILGDPPGTAVEIEEVLDFARQQLQSGKTGILLKASGQIPTGYIRQVTQTLQTIGEVQFYYGVSDQEPANR